MERPFALKTFAVYDDDTLREGLWIPWITLAKARRSGQLRFTRKGHRILYRGQWVIDWLEGDGDRDKPDPPLATPNQV